MTFDCPSCGKVTRYIDLPQPRIYFVGTDFERVTPCRHYVICRCGERAYERRQKVKTLVMMVGLPRSGKSTKAIELSKERRAAIVCPDNIRLALHGQPYVPEAEGLVWAMAKVMVRALFMSHNVVILDACNNTRKRRDEWQNTGGWRREFVVVGTPAEECALRSPGMRPIIERMAAAHEPVGEDEGAL